MIGGLIAGLVGKVIGKGGLIDTLHTSQEEKDQKALEFQALMFQWQTQLEETNREELGSRERVLIAELQQGDKYTKRARPSVIYFGLLIAFINYVLPNIVSMVYTLIWAIPAPAFTRIDMPEIFWQAWLAIASSYAIGRSMERRAQAGSVQQKIASVLQWPSGSAQRPAA